MVSKNCRRVSAIVMPITSSTTTNTWASRARVSGLPTAEMGP